jgi:GTP-binding protein HflX
LDPTVRRLRLPSGRAATLSDTVGFVSKLPHDLVEAFRSTLEEVARATLILHVADAASPELVAQIEAVRTVLGEIGASHIPEVLALNKVDLLDADRRALLLIERSIPRFPLDVRLLVPYGREDVTALLYREAEVLSEDAREDGVHVRARVGERVHALVRELVEDGDRTRG